MKFKGIIVLLLLFMGCDSNRNQKIESLDQGPLTLVIHGGAGTITKANLSSDREKAYHAALRQALDSGYAILEKGGTSVDAVVATIKVMEDSPLFNAGKGAVFTNDGRNELDASIMDGSNLMAGAVAGVTTIKNPITGAYAVMMKSEHVMLAGKGAEEFAERQGLEIVLPSYFFDSTRYEQWLRVKEKEGTSHVMEDEKFHGVISDHDIAGRILFEDRPLNKIQVKEFMSRSFPVATPDATVAHCLKLLDRYNVRHLAIFDQFDFRGVISASELMHEALTDQNVSFEEVEPKI